MPPTRETRTSDRLTDAILERQASIFDSIRSTSDRNHRFTRSLIESARQGNRDWLEVGRRLITNPTDITGVYEAVSDAVGNAQSRTIALSSEWFEEAVERAGARVPQFLRRNRLIPATDGGRPAVEK